MDDLQVLTQEIRIELAARPEVNQVENVLVCVIEVVSGVRVCLHDLPFEQLSKAKFDHERTHPIAQLLRLSGQCIDFSSIDELRHE